MTRLPMGWTNSAQILQADMVHAFKRLMVRGAAEPYVDDLFIAGTRSRHEKGDGYETITGNPGIRRFVWEHARDVMEALWTARAYGITFSGKKKIQIGREQVTVLGHDVNYEGRVPAKDKLEKVENWPACKTESEVRQFLGVIGVLRVFIKGCQTLASPLQELLRKDAPFVWGPRQQEAMDSLKKACLEAPCLTSINYESDNEVILGVDSSQNGVGWFLAQVQDNGRRKYCRFGSHTFRETTRRYAQSKLELYGLYVALNLAHFYIYGVRNLVVEVDAQYLKGMVDNPDRFIDAAVARWIANIRLYDFQWRHVPGKDHVIADAFSRRRLTDGDADGDLDEMEDLLGKHYGMMAVLAEERRDSTPIVLGDRQLPQMTMAQLSKTRQALESQIANIQAYLSNPMDLSIFDSLSTQKRRSLMRYCSRFVLVEDQLYKRYDKEGRLTMVRVVPMQDRWQVIQEMHDGMGHKGTETIHQALARRVWWPGIEADIRWFVRTCIHCQMRSIVRPIVPIRVPVIPAPLHKWHIDTKHMPAVGGGYQYILHARCPFTGYSEAKAVKSENATNITTFIEEHLVARYGPCLVLVTDNGTPYLAAMEAIMKTWPKIQHIRISAYNSRANGIVERGHLTLQEALYRSGPARMWKKNLPKVLMAERITIRPSTGYSPYYLAHGIEPSLAIDMTEDTPLGRAAQVFASEAETVRFRESETKTRKHELEGVAQALARIRRAQAEKYVQQHPGAARLEVYKRGDLVLRHNSARTDKSQPRWHQPSVVIQRTRMNNYIIVPIHEVGEMDYSAKPSHVGARRVHRYHARDDLTEIVKKILAMHPGEDYQDSDLDEEIEDEVAAEEDIVGEDEKDLYAPET